MHVLRLALAVSLLFSTGAAFQGLQFLYGFLPLTFLEMLKTPQNLYLGNYHSHRKLDWPHFAHLDQ